MAATPGVVAAGAGAHVLISLIKLIVRKILNDYQRELPQFSAISEISRSRRTGGNSPTKTIAMERRSSLPL